MTNTHYRLSSTLDRTVRGRTQRFNIQQTLPLPAHVVVAGSVVQDKHRLHKRVQALIPYKTHDMSEELLNADRLLAPNRFSWYIKVSVLCYTLPGARYRYLWTATGRCSASLVSYAGASKN